MLHSKLWRSLEATVQNQAGVVNGKHPWFLKDCLPPLQVVHKCMSYAWLLWREMLIFKEVQLSRMTWLNYSTKLMLTAFINASLYFVAGDKSQG